jgi:hypothetical protein
MEKPGAKPGFEVADPEAHRSLGDADLLGSPRETREARASLEASQPFERGHGSRHAPV